MIGGICISGCGFIVCRCRGDRVICISGCGLLCA